jgi:hypothetical protein
MKEIVDLKEINECTNENFYDEDQSEEYRNKELELK